MEAHECRILVEPAGSCSLQASTDAREAPEIRLPANSHSSPPLHSAAAPSFAIQNEKGFASLSCCFNEHAGDMKSANSEEEAGGSALGGCSSAVCELKENCLQIPQNDTASAQILHHGSLTPLELPGSGRVEFVECQGASSFHENDPVPATLSDTRSSALDVDLDKGYKASVAEKKRVGIDGGGEKICRVCHLSVEQEQDCQEAMELGCACKNDLALAHRQCAEEWFKVKGNWTCEICGCIAKNVIYRRGEDLTAQCNYETTIPVTVPAPVLAPSHGSTFWWFQQPLINFLIACTVVVFLLPWIFRTIMFN
ncbi:hypothetical protein O6H91_10G101500 [Diphasiastrum complanatum]|uniref:Uncharacterized protein n=1 Tax=Diphasiastrum complanatum TaxID=34168 RepID=A0ACC2CK74_DIPCM|nr:hypothetical protein O6H91_10G101500 [Diphasiastrum complanatum]